MGRSAVLATGTVAGLIIGTLLVAGPSSAAAPITTPADLISAVSACETPIVVGADITLTALLTVDCALTIDLGGKTLTTAGINVSAGHSLQIDDSSSPDTGVLTAAPAFPAHGAGIGVPAGATLAINGGAVTATGGQFAAGIGGYDNSEQGGTIVVNAGTVTANGGEASSGIGGGAGGSAGTVTISGGLVTADAGGSAAAIGGGIAGSGGDVTIAAGATVRAVSAFNAIGGGNTSRSLPQIPGFGSLTLSGTLELGADLYVAEGGVLAVEDGGLIRGGGVDATAGAHLQGPGRIDNGGVIALDASLVTIDVEDHDYNVTFDRQDGSAATIRLFAPDFATGYRTIPTPPAGDDWNTAFDGSGAWFTHDTGVTADITVYAVERPPEPITTPGLLLGAVAACETPVILAADISLLDYLRIDCDLTLDLNGKTLSNVAVEVTPGHELTIDDGGGPDVGTLSAVISPGAGIYLPPTSSLTIEEGNVEVRGGIGYAAIGGNSFGSPGSASSGDVTINGGLVSAQGGDSGAGIGGGYGGDAGTTTINGGHVTASGGRLASGIGGGESGAGGNLIVNGGTVVATGGAFGSGIGGGMGGAGGTVAVNAGTVTANGGGGVTTSGIGGGQRGDGGDVSIAPGATVRATGGYSAIGGGALTGDSAAFGSLTLGGTLEVSGPLVIPNSDTAEPEVVIHDGGLLRAIGADPTGGAAAEPPVTGAGQIANHGVIALDASRVGVTVTVRNYLIGFDRQDGTTPASVRLFASTIASGYRTLPTGSWNTAANGSGSAFTATSTVTSSVTVYAPPPDSDGDGVPNAADVCAGSDLSGASVTKPKSLKPNNFWFTGTALTDGKKTYSLATTGGCTANDIVRALNLGSGQLKAGLSPGSLKTWLATLS